jgi:hypothetical protein
VAAQQPRQQQYEPLRGASAPRTPGPTDPAAEEQVYRLEGTVTGPDGSAGRLSTTVSFRGPTPTAALIVAPASVPAGHGALLAWSTTHAHAVTLDGLPVPASDSRPVWPAQTTTYTLVARRNSGALAQASATLTVEQAPPPPPPDPPAPAASLTLDPPEVTRGQSSLLVWETEHADAAALNGMAVAPDGSQSVAPSATATYTLVASGPGGSATASATLTVREPDPPPDPPEPAPGLPLRFDFGTADSPAAAGWRKVTPADVYDPARGWGFTAGQVDARDRGVVAGGTHTRVEGDDLSRDFAFAQDLTFTADVPPGSHAVRLTLGDLQGGGECDVYINGLAAPPRVWTGGGYTVDRHYLAQCPEGTLAVRLVGVNSNAVLCALEVGGTYLPPTPPQSRWKFDFGPADAPLTPGYTRVHANSFYDAQRAMGFAAWYGFPFARDRGEPHPLPARTLVYNRRPTFRLDVPPGRYRVKATYFDVSVHEFRVTLQGVLQEDVTLEPGAAVESVYLADAPEGKILLALDGLALGTDDNAAISALEVEPDGGPPPPEPASATLSSDKTRVAPGETFTLAWQAQNAARAELRVAEFWGDSGVVPFVFDAAVPAGSRLTSLSSSATRAFYTLRAFGADGAADSNTVEVTRGDAPPTPPPDGPLPQVTLTLSAERIQKGQPVTASWTAQGATSLRVSGDFDPAAGDYAWLDVPPDQVASGGVTDVPDGSRAYLVRATNASGTIQVAENVTVEEDIAPPRWDGLTFLTVPLRDGTSLRIPDFGSNPTVRSVADGAWSGAATWNPPRVPQAGDVVRVSHAVACGRHEDAPLDTVDVAQGGHLILPDGTKTRLTLCNLFVRAGGRLTVTCLDPDKSASLAFAPAPYHPADSERWGNLCLLLGKVTIRGAPKTGVAALASAPKAGDLSLSLAEPATGWRPGDKLCLPDTRLLRGAMSGGEALPYEPGYENHSEVAVVAALSADGRSVRLAKPLAFDHPVAPDQRMHAGMLSHTVGLRTTDPLSPRRAHVLAGPTAELDVEGLSVHGTGRTTVDPYSAANVAFRNPLLLRGVKNARLKSVACFDPFPLVATPRVRWGVTLDDCQDDTLSGCVAFNWGGAGFLLHAGTDRRNTFEACLPCRIYGATGDAQRYDARGFRDLGWEGTGFFSRAAHNRFRNCHAADCNFGFLVAHTGLPESLTAPSAAGVPEAFDPYTQAVLEFADCSAYGGRMAQPLTAWHVGCFGSEQRPVGESTFLRFRPWHAFDRDFYNYMTHRLRFVDWVARSGRWCVYGGGDYKMEDFLAQGCDVRGYQVGFWPSSHGQRQRLEGCRIEADSCVVVEPRWGFMPAGGPLGLHGPRSIELDNTTLFGPTQIEMREEPNRSQASLVAHDAVAVRSHNGASGDDFRVYYRMQLPSAVLPQTEHDGAQVAFYGASGPNLTNEQSLARDGVCRAGELAPAGAGERAGIVGLVAEGGGGL